MPDLNAFFICCSFPFCNFFLKLRKKLLKHLRKSYLYVSLLKMQPSQKNEQWPSLSSMAEATWSWQPGLIFQLVDFLWAVSSNSPGPHLWASQPRDFEAAITGNNDWPATPLRHYAFKGEKTIRLTLIYLISLKRKKQGHAFHVCSGHICRIGLAYCILFNTACVYIFRATTH